jgi:hypothetical protein
MRIAIFVAQDVGMKRLTTEEPLQRFFMRAA